MKESLPRLDTISTEDRQRLLSQCRLKKGEVWQDAEGRHRVGVLDASNSSDMEKLFNGEKASLFIHDPPYNIVVGNKTKSEALFKDDLNKYLFLMKKWIENSLHFSEENSSFYIWLGADQNNHFQPLADVMLLMREFESLKSRSFITMRNQRGYGTQKNWMSVRQELLYYTKGDVPFNVIYTDIPKILKGYYKEIAGEITDNLQRSRSENIRASNVWIDIQQVFYRMRENMSGCYAQKPLKAIERIIEASSEENTVVCDFFAHSGTTLIASEKKGLRCFTCDIEPIFAEITIRRLEHYRKTGETGFQWNNPFELGESLKTTSLFNI